MISVAGAWRATQFVVIKLWESKKIEKDFWSLTSILINVLVAICAKRFVP